MYGQAWGQNRSGFLCVAGCVVFTATASFAGAPTALDPEIETLVTEAPVTGFINDGDQSVVETMFVYLDGCPLLSITPPESGVGTPLVTMIEPTGDCAAAVGLADKADPVLPAAMLDGGGMHIQLWRDDPSELQTIAADSSKPEEGRSLIIEVSSLYPPDPSQGGDDPVFALGTAPRFWIPGVFGDPSGNLTPTTLPGNGNGPVLFGNAPLNNNVFPFIGGGGGGGNGGVGPNTPPNSLVSSPNPQGGNSPFDKNNPLGGGTPGVAAVPLPATLLLLLWAFQMMRSFVRRR